MNIWQHFPLVLVWLALAALGHGQTSSRLTSCFLARGEQALLEISVTGGRPDEIPEISDLKDIDIRPSGRGPQTRILTDRRYEYVFEYLISGYAIGSHTIPPIPVIVDGMKTLTEPIDFVIFNPDDLKWSEVRNGEKTVRYASSFRTLGGKVYENQTIPTEIKVFVPQQLVVEDWGIPDFERDGITAWRFQPSPMRGIVNLLGSPCFSVSYPSTITATRTGKVAIGPAKVRLTTREVVMDPFPRQINPEIYLDVPKLEINALPLPPGAPEGFENAVGSFKLSASTTVTEIQEGDPITVDLVISGSGNLDTLHPPKLVDANGWKIYSTTHNPRGDERRQLAGNVVFHQSLRPLSIKTEIPSFSLAYFDPKDESYKTITTKPIPLVMHPNTALKPESNALAPPVPLERMTDILAILRPAHLTMPAASGPPVWLGHVIAILLALGLLARAFWLRHGPALRKNPILAARLAQLREIRSADDAEFLKASGSFIERWLGNQSTPEIQAVLAERDAQCFRAGNSNIRLEPKRREEILKLLRKAAVTLIFLATLGHASPARAADLATSALEAYEAAKYDDAIQLWLQAGNYDQLSADTLYDIGNACYRSGSPGHAALYYRRALVRNSAHPEARQNLRFIERKYGSISVHRPEYQYTLAKLPLPVWQSITWSGLWLCGLALLVFPATRPDARLRIAAVGALVIGPILISAGVLGWRYFPNDAEFAPVAAQAVIIGEKVALHTDAARTAPEVIDAPPGSLCEILRISGRWAYVSFATKTRGWVPIEAIEKVIPDTTPTPPDFRKPKADGKSA